MLIVDTVVHPFPSPPYSKDVLRVDRAIGDPEYADRSNFLHPVFYHYKEPPNPGSNTPLIPLHIQSSICSPLFSLSSITITYSQRVFGSVAPSLIPTSIITLWKISSLTGETVT